MSKKAKNRSKSSAIAKSTHCTSFGVCEQLPLADVKLPFALKEALKNNLMEYPGSSQLYKNYIKLINSLSSIERIEPNYYFVLFKILLYLEDNELQVIAASHNLKSQVLKEVSNKFVITVPTLDEDNPFVTIGDIVQLQRKDLQCTYFSKIVDIFRKDIVVSLSNVNHRTKILNHEVNVKFFISNWPMKCFHYALHVMFEHNLLNILYPKTDTSYYELPQHDLDWEQKSITENPEQKQAVNNILNNSAYPAPYILFGPPGTGKTMTLVETICQIRKRHRSKNILVCASSNAAADEIAKRLLIFLPPKDVYRMYSASKFSGDVQEEISLSSNFVDNMVVYLPKEIFILKKIVIATLVTCTRLVKLNLRADHFSYIFIDEASQSIEVESLIPFTLSCSQNKTTEATLHAQIIIVGDPHQLGPVIHCKQIERLLGKSLLERLMECEPYQKVENKYNSRYITKLVRNYRSQEPILHVSNKLFYDDELLCCSKPGTKKITLNWPELSNKTFPIIFFAVKGKETRSLSKSVYNEKEIMVVMRYVKKLLHARNNTCKIQQKDIGIVTPFKQQQIMIQRRLTECDLNDITVGTVETFQGQEKEIIILTAVRSEYFEHNGKQHIGFLSNPKRFNVALTRAKNLLIIVGNPSVLCKSKHWNTLWEYCKKNNACSVLEKGPD